MVVRKFQKANFDRCRGRIFNFDFGISLKMVARKTQNSKSGRGRIFNFAINLKNGRSKIQNLSFDRCRGRLFCIFVCFLKW